MLMSEIDNAIFRMENHTLTREKCVECIDNLLNWRCLSHSEITWQEKELTKYFIDNFIKRA